METVGLSSRQSVGGIGVVGLSYFKLSRVSNKKTVLYIKRNVTQFPKTLSYIIRFFIPLKHSHILISHHPFSHVPPH